MYSRIHQITVEGYKKQYTMEIYITIIIIIILSYPSACLLRSVMKGVELKCGANSGEKAAAMAEDGLEVGIGVTGSSSLFSSGLKGRT